ncbi:MAG: RidA family protein [Herbiconiux sp.]|uniref:RidA family protein n=1 Tax=Herbiconiux sp. TaxID=1871186 RepID=UPI00121CEA5D|nr:RidA family protein [Herbiconiux sp.]TAJ48080.1 MAG: RidA family protein [Herbiconiux sp.]
MATDYSSPEQRVRELGIVVPDYANPPYGERYGTMKGFHREGRTVTLSGMTPEARDGVKLYPGRVGDTVTVEQGYQAARKAAISVLGLMRYAVGSLDEVDAIVNTLCFVVTSMDFSDVNLVTNGAADLFLEVFGPEVGRSTSAGIGVMSLSGGNCFEMWTTIQSKSAVGEA